MNYFNLIIVHSSVVGGEEHHHDEPLCAPPSPLLHVDDINCMNTEEHCGYHVNVKLDGSQSIADIAETGDLCSATNHACAFAFHEHDGVAHYEGTCVSSTDHLECDGITDEANFLSCMANVATQCGAKDGDSCLYPCIWQQECSTNSHYCHEHDHCSENPDCGHLHIHCPPAQEGDIHFDCAHKHLAEELEAYCHSKDTTNKSSWGVLVLIGLGVLLIGGAAAKIESIRQWSAELSFKPVMSHHIALFVANILNGALLCHSTSYSLQVALQYSNIAEWTIGTINFSPVWLLFATLFIVIFGVLHLMSSCADDKTPSNSATKRGAVAAVEMALQGVAWGSLVGSQVHVTDLWLWSVMTVMSLGINLTFLRTSTMFHALTTGLTMLMTLLMVYVYYTQVIVPKSAMGSSAGLAFAAAMQAVVSLYQMNEIFLKSKTRKSSVAYILAILFGMAISILFYYLSGIASMAWYELYIYSTKNGISGDHDHDHAH